MTSGLQGALRPLPGRLQPVKEKVTLDKGEKTTNVGKAEIPFKKHNKTKPRRKEYLGILTRSGQAGPLASEI